MKFGLLAEIELPRDISAAFDAVWVGGLDSPGWVLVSDRASVESAAEQGLGVLAEAFAEPEDAGVWCDAYESVFTSGRCGPVNSTVNAAFAVKLPVGFGFDSGGLVGLIERYRQVGVDEVVFELVGEQSESIARSIAETVITEFDDAEVRAQADAKMARLEPMIAAAMAAGGSTKAPKNPRRELAKRINDVSQSAVQKMSDRQIELLIGSRPGIRLFFRSLASRYRPSKSGGFCGDIQYTFTTPHGKEVWTITCDEAKATARRGPSEDAKLRVSAGIADFIRVGTGEMSPPAALMSGRLEVSGDFALAVRMGEMFGGPKIG